MDILERPLTVAVSARSLFDLENSHLIFERSGLEAFKTHMKETEEHILEPGPAFPLVKALLDINKLSPDKSPLVEVLTISSIDPEAGLRIINSLSHYDLNIRKASFTGAAPISGYLKAYSVDLLLSRSNVDAQEAIDSGIAAAIMYNHPQSDLSDDTRQIRIAFDGDAVIFSDESERIYKSEGLSGFQEHESIKAREPLPDGPFANVLRTIQRLQKMDMGGVKPFRIALVTARGGNARERVLRTLRAWDIDIDEAHFLSGHKKSAILQAFKPHIFFDDQDVHVGPASKLVPSALVPWIQQSPMDDINSTN